MCFSDSMSFHANSGPGKLSEASLELLQIERKRGHWVLSRGIGDVVSFQSVEELGQPLQKIGIHRPVFGIRCPTCRDPKETQSPSPINHTRLPRPDRRRQGMVGEDRPVGTQHQPRCSCQSQIAKAPGWSGCADLRACPACRVSAGLSCDARRSHRGAAARLR